MKNYNIFPILFATVIFLTNCNNMSNSNNTQKDTIASKNDSLSETNFNDTVIYEYGFYDKIDLDTNDTIVFEHNFLKKINFKTLNIENWKFVYQKELDSLFLEKYKLKTAIYFYSNFRGEYFTEAEVPKKDYFEYNNQRFYFDSLLLQKYSPIKYCQAVDVLEVNSFYFNSKQYLTIYIADAFIMGASGQSYIYIFEIKDNNQLEYIGVFTSQFSVIECAGDFNDDGNLDFLQWTRRDTIGNVYSVLENKLQLSKDMHLYCIRISDDIFATSVIIKSRSKFPPLSNYKK